MRRFQLKCSCGKNRCIKNEKKIKQKSKVNVTPRKRVHGYVWWNTFQDENQNEYLWLLHIHACICNIVVGEILPSRGSLWGGSIHHVDLNEFRFVIHHENDGFRWSFGLKRYENFVLVDRLKPRVAVSLWLHLHCWHYVSVHLLCFRSVSLYNISHLVD